jgi:hypothetical protein
MMADPNDMEGKVRNHITTLELAGIRFNPKTTGGPSVKLRRTLTIKKKPPERFEGFQEMQGEY